MRVRVTLLSPRESVRSSPTVLWTLADGQTAKIGRMSLEALKAEAQRSERAYFSAAASRGKQFVVTSVTFRVEIAGLRMEDWKSG